jgi:hypothetical protein
MRNSLLAALWAIALAVAFLCFRGEDLGRLPSLVHFLIGCFASFHAIALRDSALGLLVTVGILFAWYGFGSLIQIALCHLEAAPAESPAWHIALACAWGAGISSLLWFLLGLLHLYTRSASALVLVTAFALGIRASWLGICRFGQRPKAGPARLAGDGRWPTTLLCLSLLPLLLAAIASLAPPTAKDALLYHIALPKAFLAGGGLVDVPGNIAQYYALGAEMNGLWGMLLGRIVGLRAGEAAFGGVEFAYLPLLALAIYGWMRQRGRSRAAALTPAALIVCIPTVYASASSGYNDLALTLYLTLAIVFAAQWWQSLKTVDAVQLGLALGFALQVKLLAVFLIVPVLVLFLFRLRQAEKTNLQDGSAGSPVEGTGNEKGGGESISRVLTTASLAILLAIVVAAPWYVRNWVRTGSPVYPFYMNLFGGHAPGWDQQRSVIDQVLNARYGGFPKSALDYLAVPLRVSLTAQPEIPRDFDGVLGISFLFGLPWLALAMRGRQLETADKIAAALAGGFFLFWCFSSEQLRYLLPALPALAIALSMAAETWGRRLRGLLSATAVLGIVVIAAWFCRQAPLPVVLGAEPRAAYLERTVDHYSIYETANRDLPAGARVWLINMRGDTYYFDRPYVYDFRIEDYTLVSWVRESGTLAELRARVQQAGITHVLARTDVLLDYAVSPVVDERRPEEENLRKFQMLRSFLLDGPILRRTDRFVLF